MGTVYASCVRAEHAREPSPIGDGSRDEAVAAWSRYAWMRLPPRPAGAFSSIHTYLKLPVPMAWKHVCLQIIMPFSHGYMTSTPWLSPNQR